MLEVSGLSQLMAEATNVYADQERTLEEVATIMNLSADALRIRMKINPIWREAFYLVGNGAKVARYATTMRRIWRAQDAAGKVTARMKKAA
jgi:hypothetical protein